MKIHWANPPKGVQNAPVYLARAEGRLDLPDAEIVMTDTASGGDHSRALIAGKFDMGHIGAPPLMAAVSRTRQYAIIGTGMLRHPPHSMLLPAGLDHLSQVRGQLIGINRRGTCSHSILRTLLAREGMEESQVGVVEMGGGLQAIESMRRDELAAVVLWEPYTTTALRELNWKIFAAGADVWSPSRYCTMIYARRSLIEGVPGLVAAALQSYGSWVTAAKRNQTAASQELIREMPQTPADHIRSAVQRDAPTWSSDTSLDRDLLERTVGELEVQSVLQHPFRLEDALISLGERPRTLD